MTRRPGKCYLVSFLDGTTTRVWAMTKRQVEKLVKFPTTIVQIKMQKRFGFKS